MLQEVTKLGGESFTIVGSAGGGSVLLRPVPVFKMPEISAVEAPQGPIPYAVGPEKTIAEIFGEPFHAPRKRQVVIWFTGRPNNGLVGGGDRTRKRMRFKI